MKASGGLAAWGAGRALDRLVISALVLFVGLSGLGVFSPRAAEARSLEDCRRAWSQAVRSYLTKNRKAGPDGSVPKDMDALEAAAEAWQRAFQPACEIEAAGDKPSARVEAAALGVRILARLDPRGCTRFLEYYMESTRPQDICRGAGSAKIEELRGRIESTIPRRG